jgi:hypothetical protein
MNDVWRFVMRWARIVLCATAAAMVPAPPALAQVVKVVLGGSQEIPPVTSPGTGNATFAVAPDRSITGKVTVSGVAVTVAHIHEAAAGANGPIIVPLTKEGDNTWVVPPGAKLTDAQFEAFKAGRLYFNIHSEAHRSGEIRGQIKP